LIAFAGVSDSSDIGEPTVPAGGGLVVTAWDVREAARALAFAALAFVLAWLVTGATDEGGVAWSERAVRTLPLAPACAALGTWLGQALAWTRGEGRALEAIGRAPLVSSAPSVLGGAAVAWMAAGAMALSARVEVSGFFPVARSPDAYVSVGHGVFVDAASGYRVEADGTLRAPPEEQGTAALPAPSTVPPRGRMAAASSTMLAGLALPLLVTRAVRGSWWPRLGLLVATLAASTLLFHAAAARVVDATVAVVPSLGLLGLVLARVATRRRVVDAAGS
jgi:hypothetical protein